MVVPENFPSTRVSKKRVKSTYYSQSHPLDSRAIAAAALTIPKKRGRPRRSQSPKNAAASTTVKTSSSLSESTPATPATVPKKRGRPRKIKPVEMTTPAQSNTNPNTTSTPSTDTALVRPGRMKPFWNYFDTICNLGIATFRSRTPSIVIGPSGNIATKVQ